jgi:hypothetical protein
MRKGRTQYLNEKLELLTDIGDVSSTLVKAEIVCEALQKNYPDKTFQVHQNNYNGGYNIHVNEMSMFEIQEFRGFMRGILVEKNWLEG